MKSREIISLAFASVLLFAACPAKAQVKDQFGQSITSDISSKVDKAKTLRLPYNKTPELAIQDARAAVAILENVLKLQPSYYRAMFNLGLAYDQAGEFSKANRIFEEAIKLRAKLGIKDITLLNSAAWVCMQNGDYDAAEKRLLMALKDIDQGEKYTQSAIYNNLGLLFFYTQRFDEAEIYLNVAAEKYDSKIAANTLQLISKTNEILKNNGATKQ